MMRARAVGMNSVLALQFRYPEDVNDCLYTD